MLISEEVVYVSKICFPRNVSAATLLNEHRGNAALWLVSTDLIPIYKMVKIYRLHCCITRIEELKQYLKKMKYRYRAAVTHNQATKSFLVQQMLVARASAALVPNKSQY